MEFKVFKPANFYVHKRYEIQEILGKGSYGVVCLAIDTSAHGSEPVRLAVKKVCRILRKEVLLRRAIREFRMMKFFRGHRNVCTRQESPPDHLLCEVGVCRRPFTNSSSFL